MTDNIAGKVVVITGASAAWVRPRPATSPRWAPSVLGAPCRTHRGACGRDHSGRRPATAVATDVTTREDVRKHVDTAVETYGRIDVLINNAGSHAALADGPASRSTSGTG